MNDLPAAEKQAEMQRMQKATAALPPDARQMMTKMMQQPAPAGAAPMVTPPSVPRSQHQAAGAGTLAWLTAALGVWLFLSAWILGFYGIGAALWSGLIVGGAVVILSLIALTQRSLSWLNAILGAYVVATPFLFAFSGHAVALVNDLIVGAAIAIAAVVHASSRRVS